MTTDEIRDELARLKGWTRICGVTGMLKEDGDLHLKWKLRHHEQWDHPMPPTLDGANAAVPEGWYWIRDGAATSHRPDGLLLRWVACERGAHNWRVVEVPDTGDPVHDLYALALACVRAQEPR